MKGNNHEKINGLETKQFVKNITIGNNQNKLTNKWYNLKTNRPLKAATRKKNQSLEAQEGCYYLA